MRLFAFLLLAFGLVQDTGAQVAYSFVPNPATTADSVRLRIDVFRCFDHVLVTSVDTSARTVTVRFDGDDDLCDDTLPANTVSPRFADVGPLPAGIYEARVVGCIVFTEQCQAVHSEQLVVAQASGMRSPIPTLSPGNVVMFGLVTLVLGAWAVGRSRMR